MEYLTSIIVPFYNEEATLEKAVLRLVNEQFKKEIILVNDGSTDKSKETNIPSIETIMNKITEVKNKNPELQILYMTDDLYSIKKLGFFCICL